MLSGSDILGHFKCFVVTAQYVFCLLKKVNSFVSL